MYNKTTTRTHEQDTMLYEYNHVHNAASLSGACCVNTGESGPDTVAMGRPELPSMPSNPPTVDGGRHYPV